MPPKNIKLDEKDREIITMLTDNPKISQEAIAAKIGLTQPSVAVRLKKLKDIGAIETICGINLLKTGLYLAKVDITTDNTTKVLDMFSDCPYFINGLVVSGKYNICLFFASEDVATLESIVDGHIRPHSFIQSVEFNIVIKTAKKLVMPMKMKVKLTDKVPCGMDVVCKDCEAYKTDGCLGCPAIGQYKGNFW